MQEDNNYCGYGSNFRVLLFQFERLKPLFVASHSRVRCKQTILKQPEHTL